MIRSTQQIIPIMHFYFFLSFAFYILSWKKGRGAGGDVEGSPRAARASHRLSEALCLGSTLVRPGLLRACQTSQLPPGSHHNLVGRPAASSSNHSPPPLLLVFAKPTLCLEQVLELACSGAACCRKVPPRLFANHRSETRLSAGSMQSL